MAVTKKVPVYLFIIKLVVCCVKNNTEDNFDPAEGKGSVDSKPEYMGEKFPDNYLKPENIVPTIDDLNLYIFSLNKTIGHYISEPNGTDVNRAVGLYFGKAILKRTLQDYCSRLQKHQYDSIVDLIKKSEYVVSHYIYSNRLYGREVVEYRVSQLFKDDTAQVYSIENFSRNRLKKWIRSKGKMNDFIEEIDQGVLPKEKYVELVESMEEYYISVWDSDECLSRVIYTPEPIDMSKMQACRRDPYCFKHISGHPSVAYTLSHRIVNLLLYRHTRRCYFQSPEHDAIHMEILCAFMYREAVYIARRGYFARDLFLEHVGLCALLGYEEFFRRHWFHKAISWMDEDGCIKEFYNYNLNRTKLLLSTAANEKEKKKLIKYFRDTVNNDCHNHPMALLVIVLAHAIRHASHYLPAVL